MNTRLLIITVLLFSISKLYCQVIENDGIMFSCDTAQTNMEFIVCSSYHVKQSFAKYDSLLNQINICFDLLIKEDSIQRQKALEEDSTTTFENWVDYVDTKKMFLESDSLFKLFVRKESMISGDLYGNGITQCLAINDRIIELYDFRIKDLMEFIKFNCDIRQLQD